MTKLTDRDRRILWSCAVSRVLTTSQIRRWHWKEANDSIVRRRLRKLAEAGYLKTVETKVCSENLVLMGNEGIKLLREAGWQEELKSEVPKDLDHHLAAC